MNVVVVGALALAVAGFAQAVRIGVRRGDWSGLIPIALIGLVIVLILMTTDVAPD